MRTIEVVKQSEVNAENIISLDTSLRLVDEVLIPINCIDYYNSLTVYSISELEYYTELYNYIKLSDLYQIKECEKALDSFNEVEVIDDDGTIYIAFVNKDYEYDEYHIVVQEDKIVLIGENDINGEIAKLAGDSLILGDKQSFRAIYLNDGVGTGCVLIQREYAERIISSCVGYEFKIGDDLIIKYNKGDTIK